MCTKVRKQLVVGDKSPMIMCLICWLFVSIDNRSTIIPGTVTKESDALQPQRMPIVLSFLFQVKNIANSQRMSNTSSSAHLARWATKIVSCSPTH